MDMLRLERHRVLRTKDEWSRMTHNLFIMKKLRGHFLVSHTIPLVKLRKFVILKIDSGIVLENFDSSWKRKNKVQIPAFCRISLCVSQSNFSIGVDTLACAETCVFTIAQRV